MSWGSQQKTNNKQEKVMSDNKDKGAAPQQISPELLQMLASMQAKAQGSQQQGAQLPQKPNMTKRQEIIMKAAQYIGVKLQNGVKNIDRFINFVVHQTDPDRNDVVQTARKPILFGVYVLIFFFGFGGLWATLAPLDSASHASGSVISDSKIQKLQFIESGNIKAIYVKAGDRVKAGDPLVALDETRMQADYDGILSQYRAYMAMEARLIAERDNDAKIIFPEFLLKDAAIPEVAKILHTQENLLKSQRESIASNIEILKKRLETLSLTEESNNKSYASQKERARAARDLFAKGFLSKKDLQDIEAKESEYKKQLNDNEGKIAETELQLSNFSSERLSKTMEELSKVQSALSESRERYNRLKDQLDHSVLNSPIDGIVNHLHATTIGGVIIGGHPVVDISPIHDALVIEARVSAKDINSVHVGLDCKIQFDAFKSRTAPVFSGKVVALSQDIVEEQGPQGQQAGAYRARIEIDMEEFNREAKSRNLQLQPGMQVSVNIVTGTRTMLRYLLDPITDTMFRAFNEK